jgi:hypothetical protein
VLGDEEGLYKHREIIFSLGAATVNKSKTGFGQVITLKRRDNDIRFFQSQMCLVDLVEETSEYGYWLLCPYIFTC